jgi:hypothetical protein
VLELVPGTPVVVSLQAPREKVWGVLLSIGSAGISIRGLDLAAFDDWMRQEARREETLLGPSTLFYPMYRVERLEADESLGPLLSYSERFALEVGRTAAEAVGFKGQAPPSTGS